jgi:hypothetical protein
LEQKLAVFALKINSLILKTESRNVSNNKTGIELMDIQEITQNMSQTIEKMTQPEKFDLLLSAKTAIRKQ